MKYWYDDNTLDEAIICYKVIDDEILVYYFNGNVSFIQYSQEIEKKLIQEMICQAEERNNEVYVENLKKINDLNNKNLFNNLVASCSYFVISNIQCLDYSLRLLNAIASVTCSLFALSKARKKIKIADQIEELEKYKLYLSMRKETEGNYNQETFNGIRFFDGNFNINTLDNYSLNEVKRIKKNLLK